jgi:hypothetical protein
MYNNPYSSDPAYPSELDSEQYPSSEPDIHHEEEHAKESVESGRDVDGRESDHITFWNSG